MKARDIVNQLAAVIPKFTTGFSESIAITSIVPTGTTALVTIPAGGIEEGQNIAITGATAPVEIDQSSFLRTGSTVQLKTNQDHDFTLSEKDKVAGKTLTISGANESEFNGTFSILRVINRREMIIAVADEGATTISGSPMIEDANGAIFNGLVTAANVTATTFEYQLPVAYSLPAVTDNAKAQTSIRITSALDIEDYIRDIYTREMIGDDLLIVQLGDVSQSKKRNEETDASSSSIGENAYTPILIQPFAVYIVMSVTDQLTGADARDKVETEYIPAIFRSLMRYSFDTGFTYSEYGTTMTGHGVFAFADEAGKNKAIYVHEVAFEQLAQLNKADMFDTENSVAMRDVSFNPLTTNLGSDQLSAAVNLDEVPL